MNAFDATILHWLNHFARRSHALDAVVVFVSKSNLLKGEALMALTWFLWFRRSPHQRAVREILLATYAGALVAIFLGRVLAGQGIFSGLVPFRVRPSANPALDWVEPWTIETAGYLPRAWNAFPSDHAMLFAAVATGLLFVSWRIGVFAWLYWVTVIGLPRLYTGLHHPTDLIGGALLGTAIALALNAGRVRAAVARRPLELLDRRPDVFYALFFLFAVQVALMFKEASAVIGEIIRIAGHRT